jgi:NADPH-dependent curcumin reductase CurA
MPDTSLPDTSLPDTSREVRLAARPAGLPTAGTFSLVSVPVPVPGPGEVLVRNRFFGVAASLRMMIAEGAQDVPGVPFPAMSPGDTLRRTARQGRTRRHRRLP